jgi:site-specific DNA-methyltransferase (adenine-specific)
MSVLQGDCRVLLAEMTDESADCIVADPPYGQTALVWDRVVSGWQTAARRVLKRAGSMWVFGTLRSFMLARDAFEGWTLSQDVVWEKHTGSGFAVDRFRRVHEQVALFYRSDARWADVYKAPQFTLDATARKVHAKATRLPHTGTIGAHVYETAEGDPRHMRSVLHVRSCHRKGIHPTQKPVDLLKPLIAYSCPPGGLVVDLFAGSGAVGVACRETDRRYIGLELDPDFARAALAAEGGAP